MAACYVLDTDFVVGLGLRNVLFILAATRFLCCTQGSQLQPLDSSSLESSVGSALARLVHRST